MAENPDDFTQLGENLHKILAHPPAGLQTNPLAILTEAYSGLVRVPKELRDAAALVHVGSELVTAHLAAGNTRLAQEIQAETLTLLGEIPGLSVHVYARLKEQVEGLIPST